MPAPGVPVNRSAQWSAKGGQAIIDMFWTFLLIRETVLGVFMPKNKFKNTPKAPEPIFMTKIQKS